MDWQNIRYPIPIDKKPTVLQAGLGLHGEWPVEEFRHDGYWSLQLCEDPADLYIGDMKIPLAHGSAVMRPPYEVLRYEYHTAPWRGYYVHFLAHPLSAEPVDVPLLQDAGDIFPEFCSTVAEAGKLLRSSPLQAEVCIWHVLWRVARLSEHSDPKPVNVHPALQKAIDVIDASMPGRIAVDGLVVASGLSHRHLNRLFHTELGLSITDYIHARRAELAKRLLHFSNMPLSVVAQQVGFPDLQQFNKFIRRAFGMSPRAFRAVAYRSAQVTLESADFTRKFSAPPKQASK